jgi:hypothetical protein
MTAGTGRPRPPLPREFLDADPAPQRPAVSRERAAARWILDLVQATGGLPGQTGSGPSGTSGTAATSAASPSASSRSAGPPSPG